MCVLLFWSAFVYTNFLIAILIINHYSQILLFISLFFDIFRIIGFKKNSSFLKLLLSRALSVIQFTYF